MTHFFGYGGGRFRLSFDASSLQAGRAEFLHPAPSQWGLCRDWLPLHWVKLKEIDPKSAKLPLGQC
jgi:hypothetical protein